MKSQYLYEGGFFSLQDIYSIPFIKEQERLSQTIEFPHITFAYKPEVFHTKLLGQAISVNAVAYGNDGLNEGLKVELVTASPELAVLFEEIEIPHITLSIATGAKAVNTRFLDFKPIVPFWFLYN